VKILQINAEESSLEGIQSGDQIVAMGAHLLSEEQKVRVAADKEAIQ
jgi:hypothetical protein